jgi:hypothetical protein
VTYIGVIQYRIKIVKVSMDVAYNHQDSKEHSKKTGSAPPAHERNSHVQRQQQQTNHRKTPTKIWDNRKPYNRKKNINNNF